jgi:biotin carboxyl carrier protein
VVRGQALMVIESMKLETTISADADAVVGEVHFKAGDTFPLKAALFSLEPAATSDD